MDGTKYTVGRRSYVVGERKIAAGDQGYRLANILQYEDDPDGLSVKNVEPKKQAEKDDKEKKGK